jgi:hypothetical protein
LGTKGQLQSLLSQTSRKPNDYYNHQAVTHKVKAGYLNPGLLQVALGTKFQCQRFKKVFPLQKQKRELWPVFWGNTSFFARRIEQGGEDKSTYFEEPSIYKCI